MTMAGTDYTASLNQYVIDHVLGWYDRGLLLVLRARVRRGEESFPSVTPLAPCADWYEREVKESLGLTPVGHPNPRKLLLSDDWPDDLFPMRKGFKNEAPPPLRRDAGFTFNAPEDAGMFNIVPYGPYHFAIHEPIYFRFHVDGERIASVDLRAGFNHRGLEKIAETRMTYETVPFIAERVCGICGSVHAEAYTQALERAAGFEPPERAKWIRVAILEMERIHSHLLWLGVASHMVGFDSGLMQFWRVRDRIMFLAELLTGNRKQYGMIVPGGVRRDIREDKRETALREVSTILREYEELLDAVLKLGTLKARLEGVGPLSEADARRLSVTGPLARASGVSMDARRDYPYEAYGQLEFETPVRGEGDVLARTIVRAYDTFESIKLVKQALKNLPGGPVHAPIEYIPPDVTSVGLVEGPRGTDVHYLITGGEDTVYRWRVRAPTYANLPAAPLMLRGQTLADASVIIGSIDPCISCAERVIVVDEASGRQRLVSGEELREGRA
jgi:Ni,Fe-hydrogenase III large subunit